MEEQGEDLPTVAAIKRVKLSVNPQVSKLIQQFDEDIADDPDPEDDDEAEEDFDLEDDVEMKTSCLQQEESLDTPELKEKPRKPIPRLISLKDLADYDKSGQEDRDAQSQRRSPVSTVSPGSRKRSAGSYGPVVSGRAHTAPGTIDKLKRCRVNVDRLGLDLIAGEPVSVSGSDLLNIAKSQCQQNLLEKLKASFDEGDAFTDFEIVFSDGKMRVHKLVLAATSLYLRDLLADPTVDCLVFPDLSLSEGGMAVEALYTGDVKISHRSVSSLSSVERCLRRFQDVGLLENYSIQISPLLPLSRFNPTKSSQDLRPLSPQSPPPGKLPPHHSKPKLREPSQNDKGEDDEKSESGDNAEPTESDVKAEDNKDPTEPSVSVVKKKDCPVREEKVRKDCNKPNFCEVSLEAVDEREKVLPRAVISWLMEAGFLCSVSPRCKGCGEPTELQDSADVDSLAWKCPSKQKCPPGPNKTSLLREHSIFQYSKDKLLFIMRIILHWRDNTSLSQCHLVTTIIIQPELISFLCIAGDGGQRGPDIFLVREMSAVFWSSFR